MKNLLIFQVNTAEELKKAMEDKPFSKECIDELRERGYKIIIIEKSSYRFAVSNRGTKEITIGGIKDQKEKEISLMHEVLHQVYDTKPIPQNKFYWNYEKKYKETTEVENLVEDEAKRLVDEKPELVKYAWESLPLEFLL